MSRASARLSPQERAALTNELLRTNALFRQNSAMLHGLPIDAGVTQVPIPDHVEPTSDAVVTAAAQTLSQTVVEATERQVRAINEAADRQAAAAAEAARQQADAARAASEQQAATAAQAAAHVAAAQTAASERATEAHCAALQSVSDSISGQDGSNGVAAAVDRAAAKVTDAMSVETGGGFGPQDQARPPAHTLPPRQDEGKEDSNQPRDGDGKPAERPWSWKKKAGLGAAAAAIGLSLPMLWNWATGPDTPPAQDPPNIAIVDPPHAGPPVNLDAAPPVQGSPGAGTANGGTGAGGSGGSATTNSVDILQQLARHNLDASPTDLGKDIYRAFKLNPELRAKLIEDVKKTLDQHNVNGHTNGADAH